MPTFPDGENKATVRGKINNAITRTDWCVLLEDTTDLASLTYDAGSAFTVAAGTQVVCAKEMYSYTVQASGASSFHLQQGSVKLNVNPVNGGWYPWGAWLPVAGGVTDNYAKLRAAGDACRIDKIPGLILPVGRYYVSQEFEVDWQANISGVKGEFFTTGFGTELLFAPGNGVRVCRANTSASGGGGDWSQLSHLNIICQSNKGTMAGHGVVLEARASLWQVKVNGFPENGFNNTASATADPSTNANLARFYDCSATGNGRDGFFFDFADSNACTLVGCNSSSNGRVNFFDSSFLGNTYIGCHADAPGLRSFGRGSDGQGYRCKLDHVATADTIPVTGADWATYWELALPSTTYPNINIGTKYYDSRAGLTTSYSILQYVSDNANAANVYIGCYAEGGTSTVGSYIRSPGTILGPAMGATEPTLANRANRPGLNPIGQATTDAGLRVSSSIGGSSPIDAFAFSNDDTGVNFALQYITASKTWELRANGTINNRSYRLADNGNTLGLPGGLMDFSPNGLAINGLRRTTGTAAPTTGTYARGDRVENSAPSAGGFAGWVCVTAGTPGTWKGYGVIEA